MGVRGLTTFINRNEYAYMDPYVVPPNSVLVLDGESIAANIYKQHLQVRNTFFGGDYEIYAEAIKKFFNILFDCKIIPYVVCSGATETRKVDTLLERMRQRINKIIQLDGTAEIDDPIYPLFIGEVFRDVLRSLNIKMVICDFEADLEAANIAKELGAPVLSLDSDFYIFDVKYIPFSLHGNDNVPNLQVQVDRTSQGDQKILTCKIFNKEKFLHSTGLSKDMLPILSIYLGNDFIERVRNIPQFLLYLKINSTSRDYIGNIIAWLGRQNSKNAVNIYLNFFSKNQQNILIDKINETVEGYTCIKSKYLRYFHFESMGELSNEGDSIQYLSQFPKQYLDKYRQGLYQHNFMSFLLHHRYFPKPLVENISCEHTYKKSYKIISAIHKILTQSSPEKFIGFARVGRNICEEIVPPYREALPSYEDIQEMDIGSRRKVFFQILEISPSFSDNCLNFFDQDWHILLITLKYLSNVTKLSQSFLNALILSKIIITYVDSKLGQIRSNSDLNNCFPNLTRRVDNTPKRTFQYLSEAQKQITQEDCITTLETLLPYFLMKNELKLNSRLFYRNLLHLMAEFQASLLHINFLNSLLNTPFDKCHVDHCYNGTLIYNVTVELYKNDGFVHFLLKNSPTLSDCFYFVINKLKDFIRTT